MTRAAKPRRPPEMRCANLPRPVISPAALRAFAQREEAALTSPAEEVSATLQAIADRFHATATAPRPPSPSEVLAWIEAARDACASLAALLPAEGLAPQLVPDLPADALVALPRLGEALKQARWRCLAQAMIATGGRPRTGGPEARKGIAHVAAVAFSPPLRGRSLARFHRWVLHQTGG